MLRSGFRVTGGFETTLAILRPLLIRDPATVLLRSHEPPGHHVVARNDRPHRRFGRGARQSSVRRRPRCTVPIHGMRPRHRAVPLYAIGYRCGYAEGQAERISGGTRDLVAIAARFCTIRAARGMRIAAACRADPLLLIISFPEPNRPPRLPICCRSADGRPIRRHASQRARRTVAERAHSSPSRP